MSIYGPLVTGRHVEQAALATLKLWLPGYLRESERRHDLAAGTLPAIRSWTTRNQLDRWPENQLPAVVLVSPGLAGEPVKDGDGLYRADWVLGVAVVVHAGTSDDTRLLASVYGGAVRLAMLHKGSLGGFATKTRWLDESYDDVPVDKTRSQVVTLDEFHVSVDEVARAFGGPKEPPEDPAAPPGDWPTVQEVEIEVETEAIA